MNSFPITSIKRNWFLEFLNKNIHFCTTVHCHMPCKGQVYVSKRFQVIISYRINLFQTTFIVKTLFLEFLNKNLNFCTTVHARMPWKTLVCMSRIFQVIIWKTINSFLTTFIVTNWFWDFLNKNLYFCPTVHGCEPCKNTTRYV